MCNSFNKKFLNEAAKALDQDAHDPSLDPSTYMDKAIEIAIQGVLNGEGGPFGCIIVKDGLIIGAGNNRVTTENDPTAHAEIIAIRQACKALNSFQLDECVLYTSCEPCPMCLGAIYWARPKKVYFGCDQKDAAAIGFDDQFIYKELEMDLSNRTIPFVQIKRVDSLKAFKAWEDKEDKIAY